MAEVSNDVRRDRVDLALAGRLPFADLTVPERAIVNAEVSAAIIEKVESTDMGAILRGEGMTTIALDADGQMVAHHPNGSESVIGHI